MRVFRKNIDVTTKPRFNVKRACCVNAKFGGGKDNSLWENPHKFYSNRNSKNKKDNYNEGGKLYSCLKNSE